MAWKCDEEQKKASTSVERRRRRQIRCIHVHSARWAQVSVYVRRCARVCGPMCVNANYRRLKWSPRRRRKKEIKFLRMCISIVFVVSLRNHFTVESLRRSSSVQHEKNYQSVCYLWRDSAALAALHFSWRLQKSTEHGQIRDEKFIYKTVTVVHLLCAVFVCDHCPKLPAGNETVALANCFLWQIN